MAVIAEKGTVASTEEVAERAGVGVATVFRHFPTKELLLEAVLGQMFEALVAHASAHLEAADPGRAFFDVLTHIVESSPTKKAVADALIDAGLELRGRSWSGGLREVLTKLLKRAQAAKAVRSDVGLPELMAILVAASRAMEHLGPEKALRKRTLGVLFDGLRAR